MNCGRTYKDDSEELIDGCECGSSLFMYEKEESLSEEELEEEKEEVKTDIQDVIAGGGEKDHIELEFDLNSISVEEEGVYNINVSRLLEEMPLVIEKSEGVYHIHLPSAFQPESSDVQIEDLD
ncbi:MAG: Zn-ribbon containing protein [Candidatus Nanohalobium sp.]